MTFRQQDISELTTLLYAAALDHRRWQEFLDRLHQISGGVKTHIFGHDSAVKTTLGILTAGYHPDAVKSFGEYYADLNVWVAGFNRGAAGELMLAEEMCAREDLIKTEFCNDWVRPNEDIVGGGGAVIFNDGSRALFFGGNSKSKGVDRLEGRWMKLLKILNPHLQQAFEINRVLEGKSLELHALGGAGDNRAAVLAVNRKRRLLYANGAAGKMLEIGLVVRLDTLNRISIPGWDISMAFNNALNALSLDRPGYSSSFNATDPAAGQGYTCRAALLVPDGLQSSPLGPVWNISEPSLLLTIQPKIAKSNPVGRLSKVFGLSPREAQVAAQLTDGSSVSEIADCNDVSVHTVRNQLKAAMAKMYVRRQSDLVRQVLQVSGH